MGQFCLNGDGCGILVRRRQRIGRPGLNSDAAVVVTWTSDLLLVGMGKQKEAQTEENYHGWYCNNGERDNVEQGADIGLQRPGALTRGIGGRT
jgi:hypothetical protein